MGGNGSVDSCIRSNSSISGSSSSGGDDSICGCCGTNIKNNNAPLKARLSSCVVPDNINVCKFILQTMIIAFVSFSRFLSSFFQADTIKWPSIRNTFRCSGFFLFSGIRLCSNSMDRIHLLYCIGDRL